MLGLDVTLLQPYCGISGLRPGVQLFAQIESDLPDSYL